MPSPRLTYCTNVHPGETLPELFANLKGPVTRVAKAFSPQQGFPLGLWLPHACALELNANPQSMEEWRELLQEHRFEVMTLNVFPIGGFHQESLKERVYEPSWLDDRRLDYTRLAADVMVEVLPENGFGSMSTVAGAHRPQGTDETVQKGIEQRLKIWVEHAHRLFLDRGKTIALSLEPEPWTTLERMSEVALFLGDRVYRMAENVWSKEWGCTGEEALSRVQRHLGVCFDLCHQAVVFEEPDFAVSALADAAISVHKTQISNALEIQDPHSHPEAIEALMSFDEPRYLHQTYLENQDGTRVFVSDLSRLPGALKQHSEIRRLRTHFHVPLHETALSCLGTTRETIIPFLKAILKRTACHHFEVETYTWSVLPEAYRPTSESLPEHIVRELSWADQALSGSSL